MSDFTDEQIRDTIQSDARLRAIALGGDVRITLSDGWPLHIVMTRLREDAEEAMREFAYADLGDARAMQDLQARVFRFRVTFDTLEQIVRRGDEAAKEVRSEEMRVE